MKNLESKFINWLITSSANPDKVALTVKGALIGCIPVILIICQMLHWSFSTDQLMEIIAGVTAIISGFLVLVGMVRKVYYLIFPNVQTPSAPQA